MEFRSFEKSWGAEIQANGSVLFRLWAPGQQQITLRIANRDHAMSATDDGWYQLQLGDIAHGTPYHYLLADGSLVPDPASRAQQSEVNGPSLVIDPHHYPWQHPDWRGRPWSETVVYALHIGTFTPAGTFQAAIAKLQALKALGTTMIEV